MSVRQPVPKTVHQRDQQDRKVTPIKAQWRRAHFSQRSTNASGNADPGAQGNRKRWFRLDGAPSLKEFARQLARESTPQGKVARDWFHNKRANDSTPPLGVGSTRKRKGSGSGTAAKKK